MTSLIGARRRAEEFDAALRTRTPATATSPEIDDLLSVVESLRAHQAPAPRPEFSASLREALLTEAAEVLTPSEVLALPPRRRGARERRLTIAASAFVLIGGTAGMAAAAQNAAPGDAFYPIKRGLENAQRSFQRDDADKGQAFLSQAGDRLDEARTLVDRDASADEVGAALRSFTTQAMTGTDLVLQSYQEDNDPELVQEVRSFTADALTSLTALGEVAPTELADEIAQAGFVLKRIDDMATQLCADCSELPSLQVPDDMRTTAEVQRATRRVQMSRPDNSHPAAAVQLPADQSADAPSTDGGTGSTTGGTKSGGTKLPSLGGDDAQVALPKDPKDLLGAVDDATGGLLGSVTDTTGKVLPGELGKTTDDLIK